MPARPDDLTRYMVLHRAYNITGPGPGKRCCGAHTTGHAGACAGPQTGGCFWCKRRVLDKANLIKPDSHTFARIPTVGVAGCKQPAPLAVPRSVACEDCEWGYGEESPTYTTTTWWVRGWSQRTQYRDEDD